MTSQGMLVLALAVLGQASTHSGGHSSGKLSIEPALKDSTSDKKFFSKDFPEDTRPVVDKKILSKLKSDNVPYPTLQSTGKFEKDFVKDENKDAGHWKAQFEYDSLRKKIEKEEADERKAKGAAAKEGADVSEAQQKADAAAKDADGAKKDVDAAKAGEESVKDSAKKDAEGDKAPSQEEQAEMKQKVAKAEEDYEEQKKAFEECKKELEDAKVKYESLKAQMNDMGEKGAADVKLWVQQHDVKLKEAKSAEDQAMAKRLAAENLLAAAQSTKVEMEKALAKEQAESDAAQKNLAKERAEKEQAKTDLEAATKKLRKLKGYVPNDHPAPTKSSAIQASSVLALLFSMSVFM
jgi:phage shock protein A